MSFASEQEVSEIVPMEQHPSSVGRSASRSADLQLIVIEPQAEWQFIDLKELWRFRELLYSLTWRDISVRYKQSVLGVAWAILQPLATMIVFSLFFGRIGRMPSGGHPYPIFVLAGLLPWFFFANGLSAASQSVIGNQNLITKIYFPRLLIPMGAVAAGLVDFAISSALLAVAMAIYGILPGVQALLLPVVVCGLVAAAFGIGVLLSALTVKYRDFRHIVPFMVQLWMFMTPAIYMDGGESFGPTLRALLPLNPVYGLIVKLIVNFRAAALGSQLDLYALAVSGAASVVLLIFGCWYFRRVERSFADVI
jgi:lipopolysaccharide transport system permease protein